MMKGLITMSNLLAAWRRLQLIASQAHGFHVKPLIHEIRIRNQVIYLDPPIELARQEWIAQLHDIIGEYTVIRAPSR